MTWMPSTSIPTDNLYKFMATVGLSMMIGLCLLMVWLVKIDMEVEWHSKEVRSYAQSVAILHNIKRRQASIAAGRLEENRLEGLLHYESIQDESKFLADAREAQESYIAKHSYVPDENPGRPLEAFERWDVRWTVLFFILVASFLTVYGFRRWKIHLHDIEAKTRALDVQIREQTLEKLKLDIAESRWKAGLYDIDARERTLDIQIRERTLEKVMLDVELAREQVSGKPSRYRARK